VPKRCYKQSVGLKGIHDPTALVAGFIRLEKCVSFQVRLKYQELYYKYRQNLDLLQTLRQQPDDQLACEASVLADFFDFLRAGGVSTRKGSKVIIVAHSLDLLPFLHQKASPGDVAMIAGVLINLSVDQSSPV
jgi:hypothetical protein